MSKIPNILIISLMCLHICFCTKQSNQRTYQNSNLKINDWNNVELNITGDTVRFLAIGDWGGLPFWPYRTFVEQNVADYMAKLSKELNIHFQLALGDNFYFDGIANASDKRFIQTFENVFKSEYLDTPWFVVLGNHDHLGNASAQIEYSKYSKRWIMPDYNYTVTVNTNNGANKFIKFLMIDTILLCGNSGSDWSGKDVFKFSSKKEKLKSKAYFSWIKDELKKASMENFTYLFVAGHFPVYSVAEHGPTKCLVDKLRPLLHQYKITAYFAGHEHDMEHLTDTYLNSTVQYVISGASNIVYNSTEHINDVPKNSLKFYWANDLQLNGALNLIEANKTHLKITYLETSGKTLYQILIKNEHK